MRGWYNQGRYMLTQTGKYSITSSYLALIGQQPRMRTAELVWTSMALPKHRFITSLAVQGRLLTQERKRKLHIRVEDTACCLCDKKVMETTLHLFVKCEWAQAIWKEMEQWTGIALQNNGIKQTLERIMLKHWKKVKKETIAATCGAIVYHIWRARNWKKFKGKSVHTKEAATQIKKEIIERLQFLSSSKKTQSCRSFVQFLLCN